MIGSKPFYNPNSWATIVVCQVGKINHFYRNYKMSLISKSSYKGSEVVKIAEDPNSPWPFSFGAAKAAVMLKALCEDPKNFITVCSEVAGEKLAPEVKTQLDELLTQIA